jgi:hypothetical protein
MVLAAAILGCHVLAGIDAFATIHSANSHTGFSPWNRQECRGPNRFFHTRRSFRLAQAREFVRPNAVGTIENA